MAPTETQLQKYEEVEEWLNMLFRVVGRADLPSSEQRRLRWQALALTRPGGGQQPQGADTTSSGNPLPALEQVLTTAGDIKGANKPSISLVKEWLRKAGRPDLASRLSKLSKARNQVAHPDVGLLDEVSTALSDNEQDDVSTALSDNEQLNLISKAAAKGKGKNKLVGKPNLVVQTGLGKVTLVADPIAKVEEPPKAEVRMEQQQLQEEMQDISAQIAKLNQIQSFQSQPFDADPDMQEIIAKKQARLDELQQLIAKNTKVAKPQRGNQAKAKSQMPG